MVIIFFIYLKIQMFFLMISLASVRCFFYDIHMSSVSLLGHHTFVYMLHGLSEALDAICVYCVRYTNLNKMICNQKIIVECGVQTHFDKTSIANLPRISSKSESALKP